MKRKKAIFFGLFGSDLGGVCLCVCVCVCVRTYTHTHTHTHTHTLGVSKSSGEILGTGFRVVCHTSLIFPEDRLSSTSQFSLSM